MQSDVIGGSEFGVALKFYGSLLAIIILLHVLFVSYRYQPLLDFGYFGGKRRPSEVDIYICSVCQRLRDGKLESSISLS